MGSTRFRKSKKIAPGVKLNVGKKGVGVSIGGKVAGVSVNTQGDVTKRVSAPGTGLSYVEREGKSKREAKKQAKAAEKAAKKQPRCPSCGAVLTTPGRFCGMCGAPLGK